MRALAAHCPSVAEAAALWGASGLPALAAHLRPGQARPTLLLLLQFRQLPCSACVERMYAQSGVHADALLPAPVPAAQPQALREAAAAALDAILRLHKTAAVKEVLAKGMRIKGLLEQYGARVFRVQGLGS